MPDTLRIIVFGAHPDDCDIKAGGIAIKYAGLEHTVRFVSVTNGDAGHHEIGGIQLARRRRAEAEAAGAIPLIDGWGVGASAPHIDMEVEEAEAVLEAFLKQR